jgi:hypothetical protein
MRALFRTSVRHRALDVGRHTRTMRGLRVIGGGTTAPLKGFVERGSASHPRAPPDGLAFLAETSHLLSIWNDRADIVEQPSALLQCSLHAGSATAKRRHRDISI